LNNFLTRTLTGLFIVLIIVGSVLFSSISYFVLFLLILIVGLFEFYGLAKLARIRPQKYVGVMIGILIFTVNFLFAIDFISNEFFFIFIPLLLIVFINELYVNNRRPFSNIAYTYLGIIYIALPLSLWNFMVMQTGDLPEDMVQTRAIFDPINFMLQPSYKIHYQPGILLGFFLLTWANDTGAYLIGVPFGRRKLFKRISPKKTWEGFFGGAIITLMAAYPVFLIFPDLTFINWLVIGAIIIVMGTFGDLVESMYKRSLGVKDTGKILPGHGGILDRFDTLLLSSPVVFTYLELIK
jgi:phosphatidate cytidylyltransferase